MKTPPPAETCRAHALKCWDAAKRATDKLARDRFLDLSQHWESMAHDIENIQALRLSLEVDRELHAKRLIEREQF